ncbi:unnamed protein product [Euphydryas editha]|uniref:Uncharacterized protein n=1 Tax=Euphydryas editha TaxID=104508 RepID=A0AAU9UVI8_EUPED|nr:unnamed protein product [Euphydryas editha]
MICFWRVTTRQYVSDLTKDNVSWSAALSPLWRARGLRTLSLTGTGLTRICRDWRTEMEWLTDLDLRYNGVSLLEFDDLQWRRRNATRVDLRYNPVRGVHYSREQFAAVLAGNVSMDFASSQVRNSHFSRLHSSDSDRRRFSSASTVDDNLRLRIGPLM